MRFFTYKGKPEKLGTHGAWRKMWSRQAKKICRGFGKRVAPSGVRCLPGGLDPSST